MTSKIILLRHAKALDRSEWNDKGLSDQSRPLTQTGIKEFVDSLKCYKKILPDIDLIISSHWKRAIHTAQCLHQVYPNANLIKDSSLNPGAGETHLISLLEKHKNKKNICLVGHQPDLSYLLCLLLNQPFEECYAFKKGGLAILDDKGRLSGFISPKLLRALGEDD